jgi:hypothetical protein
MDREAEPALSKKIERNVMKKNTELIFNEFEDATIVAFLALQGHTVKPLRNQNGRIIFEVEGDIARDVEAFYTNQQVGIMDYVRFLKSVRGQIFTLNAMKRNEKRG